MSGVGPAAGRPVRVAGIVLAAGASVRMATAKAAVPVDGVPMLVHTLDTLRQGGCWPLLVVVGDPHGGVTARLAHDAGATVVRNPDPSRGMQSSLAEALRAIETDHADVEAVVVSLVDHPRVKPETIRRLIDEHAARDTLLVVRPAIDTDAGLRLGHPYLLARGAWALALTAHSPDGMRGVLRAVDDRSATVVVDDRAILEDIDTPEGV